MLVTKIYAAAWLVMTAIAAVVFMAGTLTPAATIALGFAASVLAGAGLLVVYPVLMAEDVRMQGSPAASTRSR